jgi:hypothetical protein
MFPLRSDYLVVPVGMSAFDFHMPSDEEVETSHIFRFDDCVSYVRAL